MGRVAALDRIARLSWVLRLSRVLRLNRIVRLSWIMRQSQVAQWNCAGWPRAASYAHGKVAARCAEQVLDLSESQMNRLMPELRVVKPNGKCAEHRRSDGQPRG